VDQNGGSQFPGDGGWSLEISLDLDAVSSACPACRILLVEANSPTVDDMGTAVDTAAALGATEVSNSYGVVGEYPIEAEWDHYYNHPGVAVIAAGGDGANVTSWPATDPNVVSVGGTTLTKNPAVPRGWTETAWGHLGGIAPPGQRCTDRWASVRAQGDIVPPAPARRVHLHHPGP
jgi:subtilase family serine protease